MPVSWPVNPADRSRVRRDLALMLAYGAALMAALAAARHPGVRVTPEADQEFAQRIRFAR